MKVKMFIEKTGEMRAAQKRYFKDGRKQADLIEAKRLEKLVDVALALGVEPDEPIVTTAPTAEEERKLRLLLEDEWDAGEPEREWDAGDLLDTSAE